MQGEMGFKNKFTAKSNEHMNGHDSSICIQV